MSPVKSGADLVRMSRTRRTASALWRCAGQAITQAARLEQHGVRDRPGRRGGFADLSRRQRQDRGAARRAQELSCHGVGSPEDLAHPQRRIEPIGEFHAVWFIVDLQKRFRDPRFQFRLVIEFLDQPLGDLVEIDIDVGLHRDIDLRALPVVARQSRQAVQRVADRVQPRQRDRQANLVARLGVTI